MNNENWRESTPTRTMNTPTHLRSHTGRLEAVQAEKLLQDLRGESTTSIDTLNLLAMCMASGGAIVSSLLDQMPPPDPNTS